MARRFSFGEVKLSSGSDDTPAIPDEDRPFRIAMLGDFSGRSGRGQTETTIAGRRAVLVDRDNFDEVFSRLGVEISLPIGGTTPLTLRFSAFDDFHPDRLFERTDIFRRLREVRLRLQDPATLAAAAEELGVKSEAQPAANLSGASIGTVTSSHSHDRSGGLLEEIVGRAEGRATEGQPARAPDELQEFVRRLTEPHSTAAADPRQEDLVRAIDRTLNTQMRALLHSPAFQALEAAWRAALLLVRRIETGSGLKLYLIDISKEELVSDLDSLHDLRSSGAYKLLVEKTVGTPGAEPWALIVGNYIFGPERKEAELLARLARIANAAGAPFIAEASPRLLGCVSLADAPSPRDWRLTPDADGTAAWAALRGLSEASAIGLALPRFFLRLPYGKETDPIASFDFEEMPEARLHEDYLWGNPAFACALLLAQSFSEYGWEMRPGMHLQIDCLPLHVYEQDGESELNPCAEALLTEEAAEHILENGLMPLVTVKGRDAVRLLRFQSIAKPLRALAGRWNG